MRIAIATEDKINVTGDVENCIGFLIFEIENGQILSEQFRENYFKSKSKKGNQLKCLAEEVKDCEYLVSLGLSWKFEDDCKDYGIKTIITDEINAVSAALNMAHGMVKRKNRAKIT